jgi:outer membrane protein OmpA-like peptidoglycan-associated protein
MTKILSLACVLAWTAAATVAHATDDTAPVLKGKQVTESALIDALAVPSPADAASGATRGFRPANSANAGGSSRPAPKAGPGKASLLITFGTDSAKLTGDATRALDTVAKALQSDQLAGLAFTVEGHADPRGSAEHNLQLSQARAESVVDYLVSQKGVLRERLTAVGKGSSELLDTAHPDAPENRRVTIVTHRD